MRFGKKKTGLGLTRILLVLLILLGVGGAVGFTIFFEAEKPLASLEGTPDYIGQNASVSYQVTDEKSGIQSLNLTVSQGDTTVSLLEKLNTRNGFSLPLGPLKESGKLSFIPKDEGFTEGPVELRLETRDFSLRGWLQGNLSVVTKQVQLDVTPPRIAMIHGERYISPGGAGIAIYQLSDPAQSHGVTVNEMFFQGFPLDDGREDIFIAYFALPYNSESIRDQKIEARDNAGNLGTLNFSTVFKATRFKKDTINVSDGFLNRKIPEFQQYYPGLTGANLEKYLYANRTMRVQNNAKIAELCSQPHPERLWTGSFLRMSGSSRAGFADHRTYFYRGEVIDQQVHLGMDIASTRKADVKAANRGKVIYADYLGIYGRMVILDHGQGVFSLYSHLSQISVAPGDLLEKGSVIGLTGTSGMAGGDHLHFSMLVHGIFVTPKEWWDQNWIDVTIDEPIIDSRF